MELPNLSIRAASIGSAYLDQVEALDQMNALGDASPQLRKAILTRFDQRDAHPQRWAGQKRGMSCRADGAPIQMEMRGLPWHGAMGRKVTGRLDLALQGSASCDGRAGDRGRGWSWAVTISRCEGVWEP